MSRDLRQNFFSERIVNVWNSLADELVCSSSLNVFKNGLHKLWKNHSLPLGLLLYSLLTYDPQRLSRLPW